MSSRTPLASLRRLCEEGHLNDALRVLKSTGNEASSEDLFLVLEWCIKYKDLAVGRKLHRLIVSCGFERDVFLGNHLIRLFGLCGSLGEVNQVFDKLHAPNALTWSASISALANLGLIDQAIHLCNQTHISVSVIANDYILTTLLKSCSSNQALWQGKLVHGFAIRAGIESIIVVGNALVDMYFKCGCGEDALRVFDVMQSRDVVTWTTVVAGYVQLMNPEEATCLFLQMKEAGIEPNRVTYSSVLQACSSMGDVDTGMLLHAEIIEFDHESNVMVANMLICMYANCGRLEDGLKVFSTLKGKNVVSWTVVIKGYMYQAHCEKALLGFEQMLKEGFKVDSIFFVTILKASIGTISLDQLKLLHFCVLESGLDLHLNINNVLINVYFTYGRYMDAYRLFNRLPLKCLVASTTMITGLIEMGCHQEAIQIFWSLQHLDIEPDCIIFVSVLKAFPGIEALEQGRLIHAHIIEVGLDKDDKVASGLLDFYARHRHLEESRKVFDMLPNPDTVAWTTMIAGYVETDEYESALMSYKDMQKAGLQPDDVTCTCVLSACRHMGFVQEGCDLFISMREKYRISPDFEHYDCMANLFAYAGCLALAESILVTVPFGHNNTGWMSLLGYCTLYGDVDIGKHCIDRITSFDEEQS